jgi:hypothetical protein
MTDTTITPFNLAVPRSAIEDLHARRRANSRTAHVSSIKRWTGQQLS